MTRRYLRSLLLESGHQEGHVEADYVRIIPTPSLEECWSIVDTEYRYEEERTTFLVIESLKPIQIANASLEDFIAARAQFGTEMGGLFGSWGWINPMPLRNQ